MHENLPTAHKQCGFQKVRKRSGTRAATLQADKDAAPHSRTVSSRKRLGTILGATCNASRENCIFVK
jgi:hypothetical protein